MLPLKGLRSLHTESEISECIFHFFRIRHPFLSCMYATDAKMQKLEPDPNFFYDGRMFQRQCVNVIDTT